MDFDEWERRLTAEGLGDIELSAGYDGRAGKALARRNKGLAKRGKARPAWGYDGRRTCSPASPGLRKLTDPPGTGAVIRLTERAPAAWPSFPCPRLEGVCNPARAGRARSLDDYDADAQFGDDESGLDRRDDDEDRALFDPADYDDGARAIAADDELTGDDDDRVTKLYGALARAVAAERARPRIAWPWFTPALAVNLLTGEAEAETVARANGCSPRSLRVSLQRIVLNIRNQRDQVPVSGRSVAQKVGGVIRPNTHPAPHNTHPAPHRVIEERPRREPETVG